MKLLNIGLIRYVIIMVGLISVSIFCFYMVSTENVIESNEPIDISNATVEQISESKFIDAKITSAVCKLTYRKTFLYYDIDEYYYLIPMENGKFVIFVTEDIFQKKELENFIDKYNIDKYNREEEALNIDISGRVYNLTENEEKMFFDSAVKAGCGINSIQDAKQCIVPYKIVNNATYLSWIYILIAVISLLTAIFITLLLLRKLKVNENYVNVMPDNSCGSNENTHKIYLNDEYYTGYDNPQQNGDNIQNTQANNNQNDIHRF